MISSFIFFRFNSSSHVYFVTVQKKSYLPGEAETGFVTRISRTCITDPNFNTYSEVSLECHLGGENFNLLQAATTVPASKKVIQEHNDDGHNPCNFTSPEQINVGEVTGGSQVSPLAIFILETLSI